MQTKKILSSNIFYFFLLTTIFITFLRLPCFFVKNGGVTFIVIYLISLLILSLPILLFEISIGKKHRCNIIEFYEKFFKKNFIFSFFQVFFGLFLIIFYFSFTIFFFTEIFFTENDPSIFLHPNIFLANSFKYILVLIFLAVCFLLFFIIINRGIKKSKIQKSLAIFTIIAVIFIFLCFILSFFLDNNVTGLEYFFTFKSKYFISSQCWFDAMSLSIFTYFLGTGSVFWFLKKEKTSLDTNKLIIFSILSNTLFIIIFGFLVANLIGNLTDTSNIEKFIKDNNFANIDFLTIFKIAGYEENNIFAIAFFSYVLLTIFLPILLAIIFFLLNYFIENISFIFSTKKTKYKILALGLIFIGAFLCYYFYDTYQMALFYFIFFNIYAFMYIFTYFFLFLKNPEEIKNCFIFADNNSKIKHFSSIIGHGLFFCSMPLILSLYLWNIYYLFSIQLQFELLLSIILVSLFALLIIFYCFINYFFSKISISFYLKQNLIYFLKKLIFLILFIIFLVFLYLNFDIKVAINSFNIEYISKNNFFTYFGLVTIISYSLSVFINYYYLKKTGNFYI
ncbi:hypothetical protein JTY60_00125 [symbiont of Argiope bruennichi]|uniref:hypothetical protein n=1 Tax=symbiont of Argiope bruennichi TaxID=2810479 RepID=UPI003DA5C08E